MTNLDSILKSRHYFPRHFFPNKGPSNQSCGFSSVMYGCEHWTRKEAECWRTDAIELWCWIRLLRAPWTARSSQSTLKEISPEHSLEGLMLKLKLQYFVHLMRKTAAAAKSFQSCPTLCDPIDGSPPGSPIPGILQATDSLEKMLMLWKIERGRRRGWQRMRCLDGVTDSMDMSLSKLQPVGSQRVRHNRATELNWWYCLLWSFM